MAFAGLGAAEVLCVMPDHGGARQLLADAVTTVGRPTNTPSWPWPELRLTYANAALAEVHLAAGQHLGQQRLVDSGLRLLAWLLEQETRNQHLSTTPAEGWAAGEPRPNLRRSQPLIRAFCQQHGVSYLETSLLRSYVQAMRHLHDVGQPLRGPTPG